MFHIFNVIKDGLPIISSQNSDRSTAAIISLEQGGRLQELSLLGKNIIKEIPDFNYNASYASAVLFPFASRIENGKYTFKNTKFQLDCNEKGLNALHGLVYNKKFEIVNKIESINYASVTIAYQELEESTGFPFKYNIQLIYTLTNDELSLSVTIKNTDVNPFPFTLGWHPYFFTDGLSKSVLKFKSDKKIVFDENLITQKVIDEKTEKEFKIENKQLDDCFILNTDIVEFTTPNYQIEISTNQFENYLQLYTPKDLPLIAIEPMTGVSNSFNNKIGLQTLASKQTYSILWNVKLNH
jgi:aldose 1-epimerase